MKNKNDDQLKAPMLLAICQTEYRSLLRGVVEFSINNNAQWATDILIENLDNQTLLTATMWVVNRMMDGQAPNMQPHLDAMYHKLDLAEQTDEFLSSHFDPLVQSGFWVYHRAQQQQCLLHQELAGTHSSLPSKRPPKM